MTILRDFILVFTAAIFLSCSDYPPLEFPKVSSSSSVEFSSSSGFSSSSEAEPSSSSEAELSSSSSEAELSSSSSEAELSSSSSETESSSSSIELSSSSVALCNGTEYDPEKKFCDERGGKTYNWVKIENQIWMAENINYDSPDRKCHNYCASYGGLYHFSIAENVCPSGWHLPEELEWNKLFQFVIKNCENKTLCDRLLMANIGWNESKNGTDAYGFAALPGGYFEFNNYYNQGIEGWWAGKNKCVVISIRDSTGLVSCGNKFVSVRCIKDDD